MSRIRLLLLAGSAILILGMVLWLAISLLQLYSNIALTSPQLANLLLVFLLALVAAIVGIALYVWFKSGRSPRSPSRKLIPPVQAPTQRTEAADVTLKAIQQQIDQIQDEVARQTLLARSQTIASDRSRGDLRIVVFGTGSSGKTSIVNAVLGRVAGQVGAPMGTTAVSTPYKLRLKGLERSIWLVDTPGVLEAGVLGTEREAQTRQLATEASLLLFVLDNDLRQSEYLLLRSLVTMGKRLLVVFNKTDLYPVGDQDEIRSRLQQRLRDWVAPEDIIAVAANPQAVVLDGDRVQPEPEILPLLRRMAAVLKSEGEELMADNILLQSVRLGEEARRLLDDQRRRQAEKIIDRFQWIGAGVIAVTPLPGVDLLATAAINTQMVVEIGKIYGCEIDLEHGKELALSLVKTLIGLGVLKGAIELFSIALQTNIGTVIIGRAIQGITAAYLTRIAGKSFIEYFRNDQDWGDGGMTEVVQQQFQLNRRDEFIKAFVQEAIARIGTPLSTNHADPPSTLPDANQSQSF